MSRFETRVGRSLWRGGVIAGLTGAILTAGGYRVAHSASQSQTICQYQGDNTTHCEVLPPNPEIAHVAETIGEVSPALIGLGVLSMAAAGYADRRRSLAILIRSESTRLDELDELPFSDIEKNLPKPRQEAKYL